jgi:signal transduction histidine kinase
VLGVGGAGRAADVVETAEAADVAAATWRRPPPSPAQVRRDVVLAIGLSLLSLASVELLRSTPVGAAIDQRSGEAFAWSVAMTLPLAVRRLLPVSTMLTCSVLFYLLGTRVPVASASAVVQVALFMAIFAAWAWSRHRTRLLVATGLVVVGMFAWLVQLIGGAQLPGRSPGPVPAPVAVAVFTLAINAVYFGGAIAWGRAAHRDARRRELLERQSEQLRREQQARADQAIVAERLRIARDLHDAVAHHVTGIGVQAAAARHVLDRDPEGSRGALAAIEAASRSAVLEMHQVVGLLRDSDPAGAHDLTRPTLEDLAALTAPVVGDRFAVAFRVVGEAFAVPGPLGTAAYRAVQEALTNVRRHSGAGGADVVLRYLRDPRAVEVEVLDDGPMLGRAGGSPGFGLVGLRERAAVHDALVDVGPRPARGWRVRVRFPVPDDLS